VQSFTACTPLLTATSAIKLGRRCWSSPQQCYLHGIHMFASKVAGSLYIRCLDCEPLFDLLGGWEFNPSPWLRITPTLVTANFERGGMGRGGRKEAVGKGTTPAHCFFYKSNTEHCCEPPPLRISGYATGNGCVCRRPSGFSCQNIGQYNSGMRSVL